MPNSYVRKIIEGADVYVRGFHFKNGRPINTKEQGKVVRIKNNMADVLMPDGKTYAISTKRLSLREVK